MKNNQSSTTVAKKVTTVKVSKKVTRTLAAERKAKQAQKAKREANPQYSHLLSAKRKELRLDGKTQLLAAKQLSDALTVDGINKYENSVLLKAAKTCINKVVKDDQLLTLAIEAVRRTKTGAFVPYYFAQLIQKVVKLAAKKSMTYSTALNYIIVQNDVKAAQLSA